LKKVIISVSFAQRMQNKKGSHRPGLLNQKAFKYLEGAKLKQKDEYVFLYACCYEGLKKYNEALDLLLPSCFNKNEEIAVELAKAAGL
jgi:hypothetical protein